ncbi:MAG: RsmE family RNA methyltransferase [Acidobacteriota bacterium]
MMPPTHLAPGLDSDPLTIEGDAYRHLFRSRRMAVGDALRVVDGRGRARHGTIEAVDRKRATVRLGDVLDAREPTRRIRLKVGAPRPERAGWLVEKATEIGVDRITFVGTDRTPRDYGDGRLDRLRRMAVSAVEQCGRSWCPPIDGVVSWDQALDQAATIPALVLVPGAEALADRWAIDASDSVIEVWIGPEGGFTDDEVATLTARGVLPVGLGTSILRVETAAIAVSALLLCR